MNKPLHGLSLLLAWLIVVASALTCLLIFLRVIC